jgi:hypothetical protein
MLGFPFGVACFIYHLMHVKYLARDWFQTLSQLRSLLQDINRTQELLRHPKHLRVHHILELEPKKQRVLHIFFTQG